MKPEEIKNQRVLFSALNWGMGHVSRSIAILHQLRDQGNTIFIACSDSQQKVFEAYFDDLLFIQHDDYPFKFKGNGNFSLDLLFSFSQLRKRLLKEKGEVKKLVNEYRIDVCISDHRYGFYAKNCNSIFLTHQVQIALPKVFNWLNVIHHRLMRNFNYIWVIDDNKSKTAGKLSVNKKFKNLYYIGTQSRFSLYPSTIKENYSVVIVSGPSPYKEQFLQEQLLAAKQRVEKTIIITPQVNFNFNNLPNNIKIELSLNWRESDQIILKAKKIISRSGYSAIMDSIELQCESELCPTKGQYEQEYLAKKH